MAIVLLAVFILTPIVEIAVFIEIGGRIGLWPTLAIVVITALVGTALLRAQGLATMNAARHSLARGEFPMRQVFDGACLLVAGALLLTPGFVTDGVGLALFLPPVRDLLRRWVLASGRIRVDLGAAGRPRDDPGAAGRPRPDPDSNGGVIEGEYHEVERPPDPDKPPRGRLR
jgi:UPF0716 protein FxsA